MDTSMSIFFLDKADRCNGAVKCYDPTGNVVAYRIPRESCSMYVKSKNSMLKELMHTGVYLLIDRNKQSVYVGQAVRRSDSKLGILNRILEPHNTIEWTETVIFTTKSNNFGSTEADFLENDFYNRAKRAETYKVTNGNEPSRGDPNEELVYQLESYIEDCEVILHFLGYPVFEKPQEKPKPPEPPEPPKPTPPIGLQFHMKIKDCVATGYMEGKAFWLQKGSQITSELLPSCPDYVAKLREQHADKVDENGVTTVDIQFSSSSGAAAFVVGGSANGNDRWFDENGAKLGDIKKD